MASVAGIEGVDPDCPEDAIFDWNDTLEREGRCDDILAALDNAARN